MQSIYYDETRVTSTSLSLVPSPISMVKNVHLDVAGKTLDGAKFVSNIQCVAAGAGGTSTSCAVHQWGIDWAFTYASARSVTALPPWGQCCLLSSSWLTLWSGGLAAGAVPMLVSPGGRLFPEPQCLCRQVTCGPSFLWNPAIRTIGPSWPVLRLLRWEGAFFTFSTRVS